MIVAVDPAALPVFLRLESNAIFFLRSRSNRVIAAHVEIKHAYEPFWLWAARGLSTARRVLREDVSNETNDQPTSRLNNCSILRRRCADGRAHFQGLVPEPVIRKAAAALIPLQFARRSLPASG